MGRTIEFDVRWNSQASTLLFLKKSLNTFWYCNFNGKTFRRLGSRRFSKRFPLMHVYKILNRILVLDVFLLKNFTHAKFWNFLLSSTLTIIKNSYLEWFLDIWHIFSKILTCWEKIVYIFVFSRKKVIVLDHVEVIPVSSSKKKLW